MKKIPITGLIPNSSYSVSVRGKDVGGNYTEWSKFVTFTTAADSVAPSTPFKPSISIAGPQNIVVSHNLTNSTGGTLEKDVRYLEVYVTNSQVGAEETYVGNIPVGPLSIGSVSQSFFYPVPSNPTTITATARVKAVDASGNKSDYSSYSDPSSSIPFLSAAYIDNLTVGSLSADDITTGTLQAGVAISVGNTTPIVLKSNSIAPYGQIYIGTGTYGNANTPFYVASDNKFSLGSNLTWDGSALTITGVITANSGTFNGNINAAGGTFTGFVTFGTATLGKDNFTISTTAYSGLKIDANNYWGISSGSSTILKIGSASNYVQWSGSQLDVKGVLVATGGSFEQSMTVGSNFYIGNNLKFNNTTSTYKGFVLDADATTSRNYWIYDGTNYRFQIGNATSYVTWNGSTLTVRGDVAATSVSAGISISSPTISGGTITIGSGNAVFKADSNGIYLGNATFSSAPFRVDTAGALTASNVSITGGSITITSGSTQTSISSGQLTTNFISATGGFVGGWAVGTSSLGSGNNILYSSPSSGYSQIVTGIIKTGTSFESSANSVSGSATTVFSATGLYDALFSINGSAGAVNAKWVPSADNSYSLGGSSTTRRWSVVYSNTGTINTSDLRDKTEINNESLGLNFIEKIRPVSFKFIVGENKVDKIFDENGNFIEERITPRPGIRRHHGFIAQEIKAVLDEINAEDFSGWVIDDINDPDSHQSLRYEAFVAPLTKAIQELSQKNKELEARIAALE